MDATNARTVFVEFHTLTSYAPSNLNRDDLGTPKTALFGGVRRLRISSQCLKRTWRLSEYFRGEFADGLLGVRTARLPELMRQELGRGETPPDVVDGLISLLLALGKKAPKAKDGDDDEDEPEADEAGDASGAVSEAKEAKKEATAHLLYLSRQEIDAVKEFARENAARLADVFESKPGRRGAAPKREVNPKKIEPLRERLGETLREKCQRNAVDVALFGRFLTSAEFRHVDAAMQVAHGLGTQKVDIEYDYFTAMDDLTSDEPGAGMIGESEFAASVMYAYAACDLRALRENLGGGDEADALAARSMKAIALAMARAVPRGKKNSTAPQCPADYLEVVVRRDAPISLANAFLEPVKPAGTDVMVESVRRLRDHADRYHRAYSRDEDVLGRFVVCLRDVGMPAGVKRFERVEDLAAQVGAVVHSSVGRR